MFIHKKKRSWPKVMLIVLLILALIGSGGIYGLHRWYVEQLKPVSNSTEVIEITIKSGSSVSDIASLLKLNMLIKNERAFTTYVRGSESADKLKAGVYSLSPSMSVEQIVDLIAEGKEASTLFTVGPGLRLDQIRKKLIDSGYAESEVDKALNPALYTDIAIVKDLKAGATLEGFIYPETFQITASSTPETIIRQSLVELNKLVDSDLRNAFSSHGLSVYEAVTLASIVEKEVPSVEDRKVVAQIFLKRLSEGISLGSDATYYYAAAVFGGDPFPTLDSPYNTRMYAGLPPGPINNVSKTSLEAVAYPAETDYLFFVTGDDGVNHFTRTEAEHLQAVRQFCSTTCAPGYVPDNF